MKFIAMCLVSLVLVFNSFEAKAFNIGDFANQVMGKKKKDKKKKAAAKNNEVKVEQNRLEPQEPREITNQQSASQSGSPEKCVAIPDDVRGFRIQCN